MMMIDKFQFRVAEWMRACFSREVCVDGVERNHRFLEEALELVQSKGCTKSEAHQLVEYVYSRPLGVPHQEVGGVTVTLAALCEAGHIDMQDAALTELHRINRPEIIEKIRAKQAAKPKFSPLPQAWTPQENWLSIDSAPKDKRIRVWIPTKSEKYREEFAAWDEDRHARNPRPFWSYSRFKSEDRAHQPTHWLPASEGPQP